MADRITPKLTFVLARTDRKAFDAAMGAVPNGKSAAMLSENKAGDFKLKTIDAANAPVQMQDIRQRFQHTLEKLGIAADICVQNNDTARKSLLICDMDSTLIGQECIDELADFAGVKDRVSAITERAMRGEIGFDGALEERVGLLQGLDLSVLQRCFDERISLNPGARTLCQTMLAHGAKTAIVSGGFTFFTSRVAELCGFESHQANTLIEKSGKLTGEVGYPILGREAKYDALVTQSNGNPLDAVAIGDGANDLAMIEASGLGIAYYAKPAVADAAHCAINHTDLTSALYFQGYKDADFKTD